MERCDTTTSFCCQASVNLQQGKKELARCALGVLISKFLCFSAWASIVCWHKQKSYKKIEVHLDRARLRWPKISVFVSVLVLHGEACV